jgi:hypothetical protein
MMDPHPATFMDVSKIASASAPAFYNPYDR